ncbi:MAG: PAS domain S-box protein [Bacteroidales bacterium]
MQDPSKENNSKFYLQDHILSMALESIAECVSITDENNIILYVNRAFIKTYGYDSNEILGQHINFVRKEPFEQTMDVILEKTKMGGWKGEVINVRKNGEEFPVLLSTSIITDFDGSYLGLIGIASDITEMKKAEETYRVLVDHSIQGLLLLVENNLVFSNLMAEEILGYSSAILSKWSFEDFVKIFHPLERKEIKELFRRISVSEESLLNSEYRIITSDQEQKWIQLSVSKITYLQKYAVQIAFIDVTTRKSAELGFLRIHNQVHKQNLVFEELLRSDLSDYSGSLEKVVATAAETMNVDLVSIWHFSQDETRLECIERFNRITGRHDKGVILDYLSNPDYFDALKSERLLAVSDVYIDKRTKGFNDYFKELNIKSLLDVKIGYGTGFSGVVCIEECRNHRFWQEDEIAFAMRMVDVISFLLEANKRSDTEIALRESEKKLLEVIDTKNRFFSILAHDLKNPYNAIVGFSELLNFNYDKYSDEEKKVILGNISNSAHNTYKLLENLLHWSEIQTGSITFRPDFYDVSTLINETIRLLKPQADLKSILIFSEVNFNTEVFVDSDMIKTVFRNIISNAIHYSFPSSKVKITAHKLIRNNRDFVQIVFSDQGVGINKGNLNKLFKIQEKFHSDGTSGEKGTGLGLILSKDFIEVNEGFIQVESTLGKGTDFVIFLPSSPSAIGSG